MCHGIISVIACSGTKLANEVSGHKNGITTSFLVKLTQFKWKSRWSIHWLMRHGAFSVIVGSLTQSANEVIDHRKRPHHV